VFSDLSMEQIQTALKICQKQVNKLYRKKINCGKRGDSLRKLFTLVCETNTSVECILFLNIFVPFNTRCTERVMSCIL